MHNILDFTKTINKVGVKMNNKFWYRIFVFSVLVILVGVGGIIGYKFVKNNDNIDDYTISNDNNIDYHSVDIYDEKVESVSTKTYDIEVVYIDSYTLCDEDIVDSKIHYGAKLEDVKKIELESQEKESLKYDIVEENNERIVFKSIKEAYCSNHFKIVLEEGKINIYNKVTDDKYEIYKTLDIPVETLRIEVVEELTGGILVNSKEELNMIIEDIES